MFVGGLPDNFTVFRKDSGNSDYQSASFLANSLVYCSLVNRVQIISRFLSFGNVLCVCEGFKSKTTYFNILLFVSLKPTNLSIESHLLVFALAGSGDARLVRRGFSGCLRDVSFKMTDGPSEGWKPLDWTAATSRVAAYESWEGCPLHSVEGAHFLGHGEILLMVLFIASLFLLISKTTKTV